MIGVYKGAPQRDAATTDCARCGRIRHTSWCRRIGDKWVCELCCNADERARYRTVAEHGFWGEVP